MGSLLEIFRFSHQQIVVYVLSTNFMLRSSRKKSRLCACPCRPKFRLWGGWAEQMFNNVKKKKNLYCTHHYKKVLDTQDGGSYCPRALAVAQKSIWV